MRDANTAVEAEEDEYVDDEEDQQVPALQEPDVHPDAPRFCAWPEQRGFLQVVSDKAGDTVQVCTLRSICSCQVCVGMTRVVAEWPGVLKASSSMLLR